MFAEARVTCVHFHCIDMTILAVGRFWDHSKIRPFCCLIVDVACPLPFQRADLNVKDFRAFELNFYLIPYLL